MKITKEKLDGICLDKTGGDWPHWLVPIEFFVIDPETPRENNLTDFYYETIEDYCVDRGYSVDSKECAMIFERAFL